MKKNKSTVGVKIEKLSAPKEIILPMDMHLGKPASVIVKLGETVKIGTLVGKKDGLISANIHSSVSGTVKKIEKRLIGNKLTNVVIIKNDYREVLDDSMPKKSLLTDIVAEKGIVGMGGAGFPTEVKLRIDNDQNISNLIINAAECEPYVTSDQRIILENTESFLKGIQLVLNEYNIPNASIAIERSSVEAISQLKKNISDDRISLNVLENHYPQGAEKMIIKNILGQEIRRGKLPINLGVVILNVSTVHSIFQAVNKNMACIERVVTVSGTPINSPKNLLVRIGTPVENLIDACGGFITSPTKILRGGPMMGKLISSLNEPVTKTTNLILGLSAAETKIPEEQNCIRCSHCVNACPVGLNPILISQAYRHNDFIGAKKLGVLNCIDCGVCSYICPSKIDLLKDIRNAKTKVMEMNR